jgi:hypothetical protein
LNIQFIAKELVEVKDRFEEIKSVYTKKRDEMYNALATQPDCTYSWNGYKFTKLDASVLLTVSKDSVINALHVAGLTQEVIEKILENALVENERGPGIRITRIQA